MRHRARWFVPPAEAWRRWSAPAKTSFCCGAGGGRMWLEESAGARINEARCAQALDTDPDLVATSCPFCLTMLADGMVSADSDVPVRDIAELLAGAEK